jgi:hypothetical protein
MTTKSALQMIVKEILHTEERDTCNYEYMGKKQISPDK